MSLKRSYQVPSKYTRNTKRARTLELQVTNLKKQVSKNKPELKYYDGYLRHFDLSAERVDNQSFFTDVFDSNFTTQKNPTFIGRKVYVKKIEVRVSADSTEDVDVGVLIWREKRQGKPIASPSLYPLSIDPEYHTVLRHWEWDQDIDCKIKHFTIDFGQQGRLVEFDEQNTSVAQGAIVSGDIKANYETNSGPITAFGRIEFRLWYCDA